MGFVVDPQVKHLAQKAPGLNGIVRHAPSPPPLLAIQQLCQTTFHCSTLAYFAYFRLPFFGCDIVTNFYATQFLWQTFPIFICIPCKQPRVCLSYKLACLISLLVFAFAFPWVSASRACSAALSSYSLFSILFFIISSFLSKLVYRRKIIVTDANIYDKYM